MTRFKFNQNFEWFGPNPKCKLCALALWAFTRSETPIEIPDEAASAAYAAGAGYPVGYETLAQ